jgi:hypothetical protein
MNTLHITRGVAIVGVATAFCLGAATPAVARPEDQPTLVTQMIDRANCPLTRVGTQYAHCDDLTGMGVSAPGWIPEQP